MLETNSSTSSSFVVSSLIRCTVLLEVHIDRIVDSKIVEHLQHHPVMGFLVNLYLSGLFLADSVTDRSAYLEVLLHLTNTYSLC